MAWTAPRTWVVGEIATAAQFNTHLRDNISALVGQAATVSALQTAIGAADGIRGRLRAGSTPFEYLDVVYDATYGKWVTPAVLTATVSTASATAGATIGSYTEFNFNFTGTPWVRWAVWDTAGLKPQIRFSWVQHNFGATGVNTGGTIQVGYRKMAAGTTLTVTPVRATGSTAVASPNIGGAYTNTVQDWQDIDGGWSAQDLIQPTAYAQANPGNTGVYQLTVAAGATMEMRWVSQ